MAAEYYALSFLELKDMGLEDAADQLLKEGLAAHPGHSELLGLAKARGVPCAGYGKAPESSDLGHLIAGMMKSQEPTAKLKESKADFEGYKVSEQVSNPELRGTEFWEQLKSRDLRSILLQHGGLIRVSDFLPEEKASEALTTLQALSWVESSSSAYKAGEVESATHSFFRYDGDQVDDVIRKIGSMAPKDFRSFQAAMYQKGGNLAAHDDSNYFIVDKTDKNQSEGFPAGSLLFRKIAVIYYLTRDWQPEFGGALLDLHADRAYVPRFNSMVAFLVPRLHQVQELASSAPPRFSIFGWFSDETPYPNAEELAKMPCFSTIS